MDQSSPLEALTKLLDALFGVVAAAVVTDAAELVAVQPARESVGQISGPIEPDTQPARLCTGGRRTSAQLWRSACR